MGMCLDFDLSFLGRGGGTYTSGYRVYGYKTERSIVSFTLQNGHLSLVITLRPMYLSRENLCFMN